MIALDNKPVTGVADLVRLLDADKINRAISIEFLRRSERMKLWIGPSEPKISRSVSDVRAPIPASRSALASASRRNVRQGASSCSKLSGEISRKKLCGTIGVVRP